MNSPAAGARDALRPVIDGLVKIGLIFLGWTLAGGIVRSLAFRRYEWMEAAGKGMPPEIRTLLKKIGLFEESRTGT